MHRLRALEHNLNIEPERLASEVALIADKCDITEEIVRLKSHIAMFKNVLKQQSEGGKRLEFITQEMNREANTIAAKAQSAPVSQQIIDIKLEIEKIREQVQNVE